MKFSKLLVPILLSVSLCACNQTQEAYVLQPITVQNDIPQSVAKTDTTKVKPKEEPVAESGTITQPPKEPTTPPTSTNKKNNSASSNSSAVKDVIIDGNGNLVVSHANGTFSSFTPLKGEKGDIGAKGDKGDKGDQGDAGRGIDHCELDSDKNLIIYYTDGTSQNVGCVAVEPAILPNDYEQIGYVLPSDFPNIYTTNIEGSDGSITISNLSVKLVDVNEHNPTNKYKYNYSYEYELSNYNNIGLAYINIILDDSKNIGSNFSNNSPQSCTYQSYFTSSIPYVKITNIQSYAP